jgi:hypothetical protein
MATGLLHRQKRVAILDLQDQWPDTLEPPQAVVLHNILHNCTDERAQRARDILVRNAGIVRLVVTNAHDPYGWACSRLGLRPSAVAALLE